MRGKLILMGVEGGAIVVVVVLVNDADSKTVTWADYKYFPSDINNILVN